MDALMEADPSMNNFSWLNEALAQLFLARKCMAYRWGGAREGLAGAGLPAVVVGDGAGAGAGGNGGAGSMSLPPSVLCLLSRVALVSVV